MRGWVDDLLSCIERPETVVVMLTSGVCLRHFNPRHSLQLFQRNNYRLRPVNDAELTVAQERGWPVVDLWSISLAAGCDVESADAVHFQGPIYSDGAAILLGII